jgi:hypothetical protein
MWRVRINALTAFSTKPLAVLNIKSSQLAVCHFLSRFRLCLVHTDCSTSVVLDDELRAMDRHSIYVGHAKPRSAQ